MATSTKRHPHLRENPSDLRRAHVGDAANRLLEEGKKLANELYHEGLSKAGETQDSVKEYSDEIVKKIQDNPLSSMLIAAGVGFLLSSLLRK